MKKIASYILSSYSFIFSKPLDIILHTGYELNDAIPIPSFEENLLIDLCFNAQKIFECEKSLLEIVGDVIVVGDIHGSFHDLLRIIKFTQEKRSKVLFLGDYVDRGNFSIECITILFALKILYPDQFYMIRGNHEFDSICSQYGFKDEIINYHDPKMQKKSTILQQLTDQENNAKENHKLDDFFSNYKNEYCYKYSEGLYNAFIKAFSFLPIAAIVNNDTFCVHGGLSPILDHADKINILIKRPINDFYDCSLLSDLVWSDPTYCPNCPFLVNSRGSGYLFNIEAVNNFLKNNSIKRIIRAHECVENGIFKNFGDKLMTVFSASSYDKNTINNSGIIQLFGKDSKFKTITFLPLPRLQKSEAIYYKVQPLCMNEDKNHQCFSFLHPKLYSPSQYDSRVSQCKVSSENLSLIHTNQGKSIHLTRPKFTTNRRQSCNCIFKKPSLLNSSPLNSDNDDKYERKINNASQHLPASLFSFSDSSFLSDE